MKIWKIAKYFNTIPEHKPGLSGKEEREKRLIQAIEAFALDHNIGPINLPLVVNALGEIGLVQARRGSEYINPQPIDPSILDTAKTYGLIYNKSGSRWMTMGHFSWEKMLSDMGYFSRATPKELDKELGTT